MRILFLLLLSLSLFAAQVEIYFQGNKTFSSERLYKELGLEVSWWKKILHKKLVPKVNEKLLPSLQEELVLFYKEQGFWDVKVRLEKEQNRAIFWINEGPPLLVKAISITSDFPIDVPFAKNDRFVVSKFEQMKEEIKKELLKKGYCSYEFNPKAYVYHRSHSVYLSIYLRKGEICHIASIDVKGLQTLPKRVVLDHIYLHPGERLDLRRIDQSYTRLYSLEYFSGVRIDYSKKIQNRVFVDIWLKERKKHHLYKAGLGYESDRGALVSLNYKDFNFHTNQLSLELFHSKTQRKIFASLFVPSLPLFGKNFDSVVSGGYSLEDFHSFKQKSTQASFKILKELFTHAYTLQAQIRHLTIFDAISCIPQKEYLYATLSATYLIDRRDSKIFPKDGWYIDSRIEGSILGDPPYTKAQIKGRLYIPLRQTILLLKAHLGQLFTPSKAPPSLFFLAGGAQSNRAYGFRTIYALDSSCQTGGKSLVEGSLELRHPVWDGVYGALFWDRTYLTNSRLSLAEHVDGVGVGILYPSAVGTIKAYVGFDPFHPAQHAINIYIGALF